MQTTTLRPGLLVSLKTTVRGNVRYRSEDIEREHTTETGARRAKWQTERTIEDPAEHEAATKARSKARSLIVGACVQSAFGLLCPETNEAQLERAIAEAQQTVADFNAGAALSRVQVYTVCGRIAADDVEAARAISSEVRDLLETMERGIANLDVKAVREAAQKAQGIGRMLSPEAAARIQVAVDAARQSARRIQKAGEQAAQEIDRATINKIAGQRTAFLDLDEQGDIQAPEEQGRALDFAPEPAGAPFVPPRALPLFEID